MRWRSLALVLLFTGSAVGDSLEEIDHAIQGLKGKVLVLRNFYQGNKLLFDSTGHLTRESAPGMWTVDGVVQISSVHLNKHGVELKADRGFVARGKAGFEVARSDRKVVLTLLIDRKRVTLAEINKALMNIFLNQHDHFGDLVPSYWRKCLEPSDSQDKAPGCHLSPQLAALLGVSNSDAAVQPAPIKASTGASGDSELPYFKVAPGITPPRAISAPNPMYSEQALREHVQGIVVLSLIVDASGLPREILISSPIGYGLDEQAVAAMRQWRFAPAQKDGKPVAVAINVEMIFKVFN